MRRFGEKLVLLLVCFFGWIILGFSLALLFASYAHAMPMPETVGLHLTSVHTDNGKSARGSYGWNNNNYGAYVLWGNGLTIGTYRNSLYRQSYYAGWTMHEGWFSITVGAITGYDKAVSGKGDYSAVRCESVCREVQLKRVVLPLVAPSVRIPLTSHVSARLTLMVPPGSPAAINLAVERRF